MSAVAISIITGCECILWLSTRNQGLYLFSRDMSSLVIQVISAIAVNKIHQKPFSPLTRSGRRKLLAAHGSMYMEYFFHWNRTQKNNGDVKVSQHPLKRQLSMKSVCKHGYMHVSGFRIENSSVHVESSKFLLPLLGSTC